MFITVFNTKSGFLLSCVQTLSVVCKTDPVPIPCYLWFQGFLGSPLTYFSILISATYNEGWTIKTFPWLPPLLRPPQLPFPQSPPLLHDPHQYHLSNHQHPTCLPGSVTAGLDNTEISHSEPQMDHSVHTHILVWTGHTHSQNWILGQSFPLSENRES